MKIRNDIVKVYKDVHIWVGIVAGLMLFVAFYGGAITMFEKPLERWATPPSSLAAPVPLERAPELVSAVLAAHPEAARHYIVLVETAPDTPARVLWRVRGERRGDYTDYGASFGPDGRLQVERIRKTPVAQLVDTLHQHVGLPFPAEVSIPIMGAVSLLYALALVSGLIILLPTLVKDVFALRIGKNIKRMWLDVHNALGLVSLPFHLVMALTCVVFAFHDQFYDAQDRVVYPNGIQWGEEAAEPPPPAGARPLPAAELLRRVNEQLPGFRVYGFSFEQGDDRLEGHVTGLDTRYGTRARTYASTHLDPYTGQVDMHDLPGHLGGWDSAVNTFFMLHFGSYGGNSVRWMYLLLGLAGAMLFYTGNLLWIESRRRKDRGAGPVTQKRSVRVLGALTIGVSLGCVAGISATVAAAKWLPALVQDLALWHEAIYYAVFAAAVAWAFVRGAARAAVELLWVCAAATLAIPLSSLAGLWGIGGTWNHAGTGIVIDLVALAAVPAFALIARHARARARAGHADSVWSARTAGDAAGAVARVSAAN
ncbi:PepSY domain-containing protein [Lysobacter sp. BMK333-48F3]|uniref:PepSY-associated TM helix domain-containing protein n=1 Tax=Lysobacter sp. BMK333-48F3 TaxID=2867962 RepID=UPI001C8B68C2|nr:PepSY-associated TM helix domain-containing protein [Lysobacter sp. BMK333-48F3]MBX9400549.1 PepSY domain-containing protein [Lysobacter sp. BMK333-48F3]